MKEGQTNRPKPICPLNFFEVGGIKCINVQVMARTSSIYDHFII